MLSRGMSRAMAKAKKNKKAVVPEGYAPSDSEEFMNPVMTEYFKQKLLSWKADIITQTKETVEKLQGDWDGSPFDPDLSREMIFQLRHKSAE